MTTVVREATGDSTSRFFWSNSRSFSFAALGFKRKDRQVVERVYAFCRITDDIVDESGTKSPEEVSRRLDEWLEQARTAYLGGTSDTDWLDELMQGSSAQGVPFEVIETLIRGVGTDATFTEIESVGDLQSYCYGVASVVGVWLCYLFGIAGQWHLQRAEALGRGMQITNILRDVGEDLRRGRVYLPTDLMRRHGVTRSDLESAVVSGQPPEGYEGLIGELIDLADGDYEMAWEAIPTLPPSFARASAVAAEVYRAIHRKVPTNGFNNFTVRARTGYIQKMLLMSRAIIRLWTARARSASTSREISGIALLATLLITKML